MKKHPLIYSAFTLLLIIGACKQEVIELQPPVVTTVTPSKGTANFTKFIAIGSSYTAGFQAGALFTNGQNNSLPAMLNKQFEMVGAPATFNQPTIGSELGYNIFVTPNPDVAGNVYGRFLLQYNGAASPKPTAQLSSPAALPSPLNPAFKYNGNTAALNNFGVQAIYLAQALTPATGGPPVGGNPAYSPFYARFASSPSPDGVNGSKLIGDAATSGGTFFLFWLGMDDFLLHAAYGGDGAKAPLTDAGAFSAYYNIAINAMLSVPNLNGVVANFPDIFKMPHFTSVSYNPIPLDAATASAVSAGFAGYNAALDGLIANAPAFGISASVVAEIGGRKVTFAAAADNKILIADETLTDLGPYFDGMLGLGFISPAQRAALAPYQKVRQTTPNDIIPLSAGNVLGTTVGGNPLLVNGVSVPLADQYVLIPSEITAINNARTAFNATVAAAASAHSDRLAFADIDAALNTLISNKAAVMNNVTITPNINPPTGIYSEDGIHPNTRGYAFLSTVIIQAINAKYAATIPLTDISLYGGTGLPIP